MLTDNHKSEVMNWMTEEIQMASRYESPHYMPIIVAQKHYMDDVVEMFKQNEFHVVDMGEMKKSQKFTNSEFLDFLGYNEHDRFMLKLPRIIPTSACTFFHYIVKEGVITANPLFDKHVLFQGKTFICLIDMEDWENIEPNPAKVRSLDETIFIICLNMNSDIYLIGLSVY